LISAIILPVDAAIALSGSLFNGFNKLDKSGSSLNYMYFNMTKWN